MKRNATRRLLTALLAAAMCLSMAACGSKPAADNGSSDTDASAGDDAARKYTIGVCQLVTHDALDAATQGFIDAVQEKLGADNVDISVQNAANDQQCLHHHRQHLRLPEGRSDHGQRHPVPAGRV